MRIQPDDTEIIETLPHPGRTAQAQRMIAADHQRESTAAQDVVDQLGEVVIDFDNRV